MFLTNLTVAVHLLVKPSPSPSSYLGIQDPACALWIFQLLLALLQAVTTGSELFGISISAQWPKASNCFPGFAAEELWDPGSWVTDPKPNGDVLGWTGRCPVCLGISWRLPLTKSQRVTPSWLVDRCLDSVIKISTRKMEGLLSCWNPSRFIEDWVKEQGGRNRSRVTTTLRGGRLQEWPGKEGPEYITGKRKAWLGY